jgi:hypothetical protein
MLAKNWAGAEYSYVSPTEQKEEAEWHDLPQVGQICWLARFVYMAAPSHIHRAYRKE